MKVAVAGAGAVGRSVTRELVENGHDITLIERNPDHLDAAAIPEAHWRLGDACELSLLESIHLEEFDVVVAATGDDKVNVVLSLLAKTEFAVPRVVARVNDPRNEWLFNDAWGVDVAVSTPRMLASLIEEAVTIGDLVRLMEFRTGQAQSGRDHPARQHAVGRQTGAQTSAAAGCRAGDNPARATSHRAGGRRAAGRRRRVALRRSHRSRGGAEQAAAAVHVTGGLYSRPASASNSAAPPTAAAS